MRNIATLTDCVSLVTRLQEQSCDMRAEFKMLVLSEKCIPVKSASLAVGPASQNEQAIHKSASSQYEQIIHNAPWLKTLDTGFQREHTVHETPSQITICPPSQYTALLGQEFDIVVYDLSAGFRASVFLVLSGLVRGDGWLFLTNIDEAFSGLTFSYTARPTESADISSHSSSGSFDPQSSQDSTVSHSSSVAFVSPHSSDYLTSFSSSTSLNTLGFAHPDISIRPNLNDERLKKPSYLLQHLLAQIPKHLENLPDNFISQIGQARFIAAWEEQKSSAAKTQQGIREEIVESILKSRCKTVNHKDPASNNIASCDDIGCGEIGCGEIVCEDGICEDEVFHHVIAAPRGRGKSYLLGQIIGDLTTHSTDMHIGILTQNRKQISSLLDQVAKSLKTAVQTQEMSAVVDHMVGNEQASNIHTLPPDVDFNQYPYFDVLVIDEAASFPVELLLHYRKHTKYLIYGTTTHGYEGTGMGFTHKYLPKVLATDSVHQYALTQPFRFISPCPIEQVCDDAISQLSTNTQHQNNLLNYTDGLHWLATQALRENTEQAKSTLAALMQLLSLAHYQTTPDDLQRIIDSDDMRCLIYVENKRLIGCVWLIEEGLAHCDHSTKHAILSGTRRVPGHLTVQQLGHGYHIPDILEWNVWRINRIAVLPNEQHNGIGSLLMRTVFQCAQSLPVDALTSSFGAEKGLISFWQKQGFTIWKEGQKANKVTGYHNCIVGVILNNDNNKSGDQESAICLGEDASETHEKQHTNELLKKHYILAKQWQGMQKTQVPELGVNKQCVGSDKVNKSDAVNKSEKVNKSDTVNKSNTVNKSEKKPKLPIAFTLKHGNQSPFIQAQIAILQQYIAGSRSLDNAEASIFWFISMLMNEGDLSLDEKDAHATIWLVRGTVELERKTLEKKTDYFNISELLLARYQHGHSIKECCKKFQIQGKKMFSELVAEQVKVLLFNALEH